MLFDSLSYAFFFSLVFCIYWIILKNVKQQNFFLCIASFFFYGCWDWRFLFLLLFSICLNYLTGLCLYNNIDKKPKNKYILWFAIILNISVLGFFKYFNFFIESTVDFLSLLGFKAHLVTLKIVLPVGISFYTFHGLSYIIDIYNKKMTPTTNFINYSLFVSFFTLLVAGPIERATHLLPQIENQRSFEYLKATDGLKQILWGLFKKIVIADNCAIVVDSIYSDYSHLGSLSLVLAALLFSVQIYCDFSGYSDIALGSSRVLGFELLKNFNYPYFSRNIAEFWRRWHISLTSWFKDYIYIPLGGSRRGIKKQIFNTFIIFLVSGFWHGANWTFILWGGVNACLIIPSIFFKSKKGTDVVAKGKFIPSLKESLQLLLTFIVATLAWTIFRGNSIQEVFYYFSRMFSFENIGSSLHYMGLIRLPYLLLLISLVFIIEWFAKEKNFGLQALTNVPRWLRIVFYYFLIVLILSLKVPEPQQFIYFQF